MRVLADAGGPRRIGAVQFQPFPVVGAMARNQLPPVPDRKQPSKGYGQGYEAYAVREELGGFDFESCPAWRSVTDYFGTNIRLRELKGIMFALTCHIKGKSGLAIPGPSRNAKRNLPLLVKYINEHYSDFVPLFPSVTLCDDDKTPIPFLDARIGRPRSREGNE
jgi:hypothetical protein